MARQVVGAVPPDSVPILSSEVALEAGPLDSLAWGSERVSPLSGRPTDCSVGLRDSFRPPYCRRMPFDFEQLRNVTPRG